MDSKDNHKCLSVCSSVRLCVSIKAKPLNSLKSSSYIIHLSSFIILHSSFLHFPTFQLVPLSFPPFSICFLVKRCSCKTWWILWATSQKWLRVKIVLSHHLLSSPLLPSLCLGYLVIKLWVLLLFDLTSQSFFWSENIFLTTLLFLLLFGLQFKLIVKVVYST